MKNPYRTVVLSAVKAGITRLRTKGGASPESLYDLLNGYVTAQRTIAMRPGSVIEEVLSASAVGIAAHNGKLMYFTSNVEVAPSDLFEPQVLRHPTDAAATIADIHFAEPFAGAPYVVAEFNDGQAFHFYLESSRTWAANTVYLVGQLVQPTTANGLAYKATRLGDTYPAWKPGLGVTVGYKVEPTTYTGYYYEVTAVSGSNVITGDSEPTWPTNEGQTVIESADTGTVTTTTTEDPGEPSGGVGGATDDDPYTGNGPRFDNDLFD